MGLRELCQKRFNQAEEVEDEQADHNQHNRSPVFWVQRTNDPFMLKISKLEEETIATKDQESSVQGSRRYPMTNATKSPIDQDVKTLMPPSLMRKILSETEHGTSEPFGKKSEERNW